MIVDMIYIIHSNVLKESVQYYGLNLKHMGLTVEHGQSFPSDWN